MTKGISIIICTYNGARLLPATLKCIAQLQKPIDVPVELLIIDNASTDGTREASIVIWKTLKEPIPLIVIEEKKAGVGFARRTGIEAAHYPLIVFCDDDNRLSSDYLIHSHRIMTQNEKIAVCGGWGKPVFQSVKPDWFEGYAGIYGCGPQGIDEGPSDRKHYLYTAGLVLRKSIVQQIFEVGFENKMVGRQGNSLSSGEDTELTTFMAILGYEIWYSPKLVFGHYMEEKRLNLPYLKRLTIGIVQAEAGLMPYRMVYSGKWRSLKGTWVFQFFVALAQYLTDWTKKDGELYSVKRLKLWMRLKSIWAIRVRNRREIRRILNLKKKYHKRFGAENNLGL